MRLIPGYSLERENQEAVMNLLGGVGESLPNISEIARKFAKSRPCCKRNGHGLFCDFCEICELLLLIIVIPISSLQDLQI